jgi:hypothetical protein
VSGNGVMRGIFAPKREEVTGGFIKSHNDDLLVFLRGIFCTAPFVWTA